MVVSPDENEAGREKDEKKKKKKDNPYLGYCHGRRQLDKLTSNGEICVV